MPRAFISHTTKQSVLEALSKGLSTTEIRKKFDLKSRNNVYRIRNSAKGIPENLQGNWSSLVELSKAKPEARTLIIEEASEELLTSIRECCLNLLKGAIPLTEGQLAVLANYKSDIRAIGELKNKPRKIRRFLLEKQSGFLPALLHPILNFFKNGTSETQ
jgi:hypothetical protein